MSNFWRYLLFAVVLFIGSIAFIVVRNWDTVSVMWENATAMNEGSREAGTIRSPDDLVTYLAEHPERVSLVVRDASEAAEARTSVRAGVARPAHRFSQMLLLAEAERQMEAGMLDSTAQVPLDSVGLFALPGVTSQAHDRAVDSLRSAGLVSDGAVPLAAVVRGIETFTDAAAADWLMMRLGRETVLSLPEAYGLSASAAPRPATGVYLAWRDARRAALSRGVSPDSAHHVAVETLANGLEVAGRSFDLAERLRADASFRQDVLAPLDDGVTELTFRQQRDLARVGHPRVAAEAFADVMASLVRGDLATAGVSARLSRQIEQQVKPDSLGNTPRVSAIGSMAGAYPGMLHFAGYARHADGQPDRVVVMVLEDLPLAVFYHLAQTGIDKGLVLQLLIDDGYAQEVEAAFESAGTLADHQPGAQTP